MANAPVPLVSSHSSFKRDGSTLGDIAVRFLHAISCFGQSLANLTRDQDAAMVAARASERNGQVALAFRDVMRQQVDQKRRDALDKLLSLRKRPDVTRHAG